MNVLILAAGYATRLYPLTRDFPKPLLKVGNKTILDHLVDQIRTVPEIEHALLITNHRFVDHFRRWAAHKAATARQSRRVHTGLRFDIIDDGTASIDDRLGAVGDIQYAIARHAIADDLLVCAADNILQFPLEHFVGVYRANPVSHICVRAIEDVEDRKRRGIAVLNDGGRIVEFAEKPGCPKSHWGSLPLYIYPAAILPRIGEYLKSGGNPDAPGHFIEWLCGVEPVHAYKIQGSVLDIGNHELLAEAREVFRS